MFDLLQWSERARQFVRGLAGLPGGVELHDSVLPPAKLDPKQRDWLRSRKCSLPPEIRQFVESVSAHCAFGYRWSPPADWRKRLQSLLPGQDVLTGGANLCETCGYSIYDDRQAVESLLSGLQLPQGILQNAGVTRDRGRFLPLARLEEDRELVLELESDDGRRGVGCRSAPSARDFVRFSASFEEFLTHWETICYVTPDTQTLRPWLDSATGLLRPDPGKAAALQAIFQEAAKTHVERSS